MAFWRSNIWNADISEMVRAGTQWIGRLSYILKFAKNDAIAEVVLHDIDLLWGNELEM